MQLTLLKRFLFTNKKINSFARLRESLFLFADIISPALEKTRSDGTLVAGTIKYFFTKLKILGNLNLFKFHHSNTSFVSITNSLKYKSNSFLTAELVVFSSC